MRQTTLLAAFVCLIGTLLPAAEGKRLAFVVGVDQYENLPPEAALILDFVEASKRGIARPRRNARELETAVGD